MEAGVLPARGRLRLPAPQRPALRNVPGWTTDFANSALLIEQPGPPQLRPTSTHPTMTRSDPLPHRRHPRTHPRSPTPAPSAGGRRDHAIGVRLRYPRCLQPGDARRADCRRTRPARACELARKGCAARSALCDALSGQFDHHHASLCTTMLVPHPARFAIVRTRRVACLGGLGVGSMIRAVANGCGSGRSIRMGQRLLRIVRRSSGPVVTWRRAQMILLSAQGMPPAKIAEGADQHRRDRRRHDPVPDRRARGVVGETVSGEQRAGRQTLLRPHPPRRHLAARSTRGSASSASRSRTTYLSAHYGGSPPAAAANTLSSRSPTPCS